MSRRDRKKRDTISAPQQLPSSPEIEVETIEQPVEMLVLDGSDQSTMQSNDYSSDDSADEPFHTANDMTFAEYNSDESDLDQSDDESNNQQSNSSDNNSTVGTDGEDDAAVDSGDEEFADINDEMQIDTALVGEKVTPDTKQIKNEMMEHKEQLELLKSQDPEFYEYLRQNDQRLLDFEPEEEEDDEDDEDEGDDEGADEGEEDGNTGANDLPDESSDSDGQYDDVKVVDAQQIKQWSQLVQSNHQLRALHSLVVAFKCAAHSSDDGTTAGSSPSLSLPFALADEQAFTELIIAAVKYVPPALHYHLKTGSEGVGKGKTRQSLLPSQSRHWSRHQMLVKTFVKSAIHLLGQLTDPEMVEFILRELDKSAGIVFFASQPRSKSCKDFLRYLIKHWSSVPATGADQQQLSSSDNSLATKSKNGDSKETLRIVAFLCIRQLATLASSSCPDLLNSIYKLTYQSFLASAKHANFTNLSSLGFMTNCLVELLAAEADRVAAYQFAFVSIRQLAIQLRTAITQHTQEALQQVQQWQFVYAIRLWSRLLSTVISPRHKQSKEENNMGGFEKLVFPVTQIALGAAGLTRSSSQFYFLQLHLLRCLSDLSFRCQVYIPIAGQVLDILSGLCGPSAGKIQPCSQKSIDVSTTLRVSRALIHSKLYSDTVFDECMDLLMECLSIYSTSVAFPELVAQLMARMKRIAKNTIVPRFNKQLMGLLQQLDKQRGAVKQKRQRSIAFGPESEEKCKKFALDGCVDLDGAVRKSDFGRYIMACKRVREQRRQAEAVK